MVRLTVQKYVAYDAYVKSCHYWLCILVLFYEMENAAVKNTLVEPLKTDKCLILDALKFASLWRS